MVTATAYRISSSNWSRRIKSSRRHVGEGGSEEIMYRFPDVFGRVEIHIQKNFTILLEALEELVVGI